MDKFHAFHKTKQGYIIFALIEIALLYVVVSVAIDTANMFVYFAGIVLIIAIVFNIKNAIALQLKK